MTQGMGAQKTSSGKGCWAYPLVTVVGIKVSKTQLYFSLYPCIPLPKTDPIRMNL